MNDILNQDYPQATKNLSKEQEAALKKISELNEEIAKIKNQNKKKITDLLRKNNLNRMDISGYSRNKGINSFLNIDFTK